MFRFRWTYPILGLAAWGWTCAAPAKPAPDPDLRLRAACEAASAPDAACVDLLTRPDIESRRQVEAAEAERRADAFRGRLASLRAQEETRQLRRRSTTATAAVARLLDRRPFSDEDRSRADRDRSRPAILFEGDSVAEAGPSAAPFDVPSGRSAAGEARAVADAQSPPGARPATDGRLGAATAVVRSRKTAPTGGPGAAAGPQAVSGERPVASAPGRAPPAVALGPTPEMLLRASRCVLQADRRAGQTALTRYRREAAADSSKVGLWALALTDATALTDRIDAELSHRKLAKSGPVCTSSDLRPVVALLRSLVGPGPSTASSALGYGRGLERLDRELQTRAGLPRAE